MARISLESNPRDISALIGATAPRLLMLCAPPGYGKLAMLRAYAAGAGELAICELPRPPQASDLARTVLDALLEGKAARAARSAADRLAQRRETARFTSRETLRREWSVDAGPELFVFHDPAGTLATPGGADLFAELAETAPHSRRLAICTREALPPALQHVTAREDACCITASDLRLSADDVVLLAGREGVTPEAALALYDIAAGWPLVTTLLLRLLQHEPAAALMEALSAIAPDAFFGFAVHRTIARSSTAVRDALAATALRRGSTHVQLVRVLGDACDDAAFARLTQLPFVEYSAHDQAAHVHGEVVRLLRERFEPLMRSLYDRTLQVLAGDGEYVEGARIALDAGDVERAAAVIDAAPPYTTARVPIGEYERIVDRIDRSLITRFPNLWIATIPYRSFSVDPATYVREAETVYYCLPPSSTPDQRAAVLMLLASAYANVGRCEDADQAITDALQGFAAGHGSARASVLNFAAALRGIEGRFTLARELAAEAAEISQDTFGESQRLHYIDSHEATYRGRQDRFAVIIDELLRRRSREDLPLYRAYLAANGAVFSWAAGDDAAFARYVTELEDAITPGLEPGFGPIIDAARGRPVSLAADCPFLETAAIAHLYQLGSAADVESALVAARAAARAADARRDPFLQMLAHVALYVLDDASRAEEARVIEAIVKPVESPELHEALDGLFAGRSAGMLDSFVRLRVRRQRERSEPRLVVELLAGRVSRDDTAIPLTDKEFEVLALLASTHGMLSRERIGEALWEHLDPGEWRNNFKATLYRIRLKLGARDAIVADGGRYRLASAIDVDLRRAESLVRELASSRLDESARARLRAVVETYAAGNAARYDRFSWAQPLLGRIGDVVCDAAIALAADARHSGDRSDALRYAACVTTIDPLNERACEMTIHVLLDRADLDGARREFRRFATALENELGAAPPEHLTELLRVHP